MASGLERIDWAAPWLAPLRWRGQVACAEALALARQAAGPGPVPPPAHPPASRALPGPEEHAAYRLGLGRALAPAALAAAQPVPAGACVATALNQARALPAQPPARAAARACPAARDTGSAADTDTDTDTAADAKPPRFVAQSALAAGMAYEWHIHLHRSVPTRDNVHDFFNGLIWLHWPRSKQRLHAWQAQALARTGGRVLAARGRLRDRLTVLDENGALLQAPEALWQALQERDWGRLFGPLRPQWAQARLSLFGHALLEKLLQPRAPIVAHVLQLRPPLALQGPALDAWLADQLSPALLLDRPFAPLPVLGVPGWWPANEDPAFYADTQVFRPARPRAVDPAVTD